MPSPTIHEFAAMADASYVVNREPLVPNYTRIHFQVSPTGFKGSRFHLAEGRATYRVVAFAGTDFGGENGTDTNDLLADVGFSGADPGPLQYIASPVLSVILARGRQQLMAQITDALAMTAQAVMSAEGPSNVYVVGHSLGGGLAQIVAAKLGIRGIAFNAPTVSQLGYDISPKENFLSINQFNDPVSAATRAIGNHLGVLREVNNGTDGFGAHSMKALVDYFGSSGGRIHGEKRPW
jgi:pimeloyl-ACP methyl ester carboxylesterase